MSTTSTTDKAAAKPRSRFKWLLYYLPTVLTLLFGLRMYSLTQGTKLLFTESGNGRFYRYYPVFLVLSILLFIAAVIYHRKKAAEKPVQTEVDETPVSDSSAAAEIVPHSDTADEAVLICPSCNNEISAGESFCSKCGTKLGSEENK